MPRPERQAASRLMLYAMLLAASYTLMRSAGDSLFLSRIGNDRLAIVFLISGIGTAILALAWFALTRRMRLETSLRVSGIASAIATFSAWVALPYFHHSIWLLGAIYLLTELKGCINSINVVAASNEILGGHSSRSAWARIGMGAPLAGVFIGILIGLEAELVSLETWLLLSVALDLVALIPLANCRMLVVRAEAPHQVSLPSSLERIGNSLRRYACSRQFRFWIGVLIAAKIVVLTLVAFLWKVSINDFYSGNEQSLSRYFGVFYACIGGLTLLVQVGLTGRLLSRQNLHVPLLAMPVVLSVVSVAMVFGSGALFLLVAMTLAKSTEVWRRSVHDTTLSFLYTRIERGKRRNAISFNTAFIKPLAEVAASLALVILSVSGSKLAILCILAIWILAAYRLLRLVHGFGSQPKSSSDHSNQSGSNLIQTPYSEPA